VNLVDWVLPYIQLVIWALVLQGLVLRVASNARLLEVLRFHQLLVRLRVRLHVQSVLYEFQLVASASLFLHVLTRCRWGWHLVVVTSDWALGGNWSLWLHEVRRVHLVSSQHLLGRIAKGGPYGLATIDARGSHTGNARHLDETPLHKVARGLSTVPLAGGIDILHGHRGRVLDGWGPLCSMVLLQKRMVALLMTHTAINLVLGCVSRLYVRQEAVVGRQQLGTGLTRKHQIRLVWTSAHHNFLRLPLVLLACSLLVLGHARLDAHVFVFNALLVVRGDSLRRSTLLMLVPQNLSRSIVQAGWRHWMVQFWLLVIVRVLRHFRLKSSI